MKLRILFWLLAVTCSGSVTKQQRTFPDDFVFGTATAAYQVEGAWDHDDKSENIWDHVTHNKPYLIKDMSNGDIAADSYHNYKRDIEMLRELGVDVYRFSISWSRILPSGFANHVSEAGLNFYNNYINEMLKYNITPVITIYHWDLPQRLQDLGGWTNPLIVDLYLDFAKIAFEQFGDRVKFWVTMNELKEICYRGYGVGEWAPLVNASGIGDYLCAKHFLLAHVKAYRLYEKEFKPKQGGICGVTLSMTWYEPETDSEEDILAVKLMEQAQFGLITHPIFSKEGDFPKELKARIAEKSAKQGFPRSRLPELTEEEIQLAKGASDFLGVNHYSGVVVSASNYKSFNPIPSLDDDVDAGSYRREDWPALSTGSLISPNALYNILVNLKQQYNDPIIYITENGRGIDHQLDGQKDDERAEYLKIALNDVAAAVEDGVRVKGYMAWSLMDNFEWTQGYTKRFGLYHVNFTDPARTRTPKKSAFVYKQIVKTRTVDFDYEPNNFTMTIDEEH